jgi:YceI-like domain
LSQHAAAAVAIDPIARAFAVDPVSSTIRYHAAHRLHRATGLSRSAQGKAIVHEDGRVLAAVLVPVASFRSGDVDRDARVREILGTGGPAVVVFKASGRLAPAEVRASRASVELALEGELTLHGVRRPMAIQVALELAPDGTARVRGSFEVSLDSHGVVRPSLLLIKVEDTCRIELDLVLRAVQV